MMIELAKEEGVLLKPDSAYPVWSPYQVFEAADTLLDALTADRAASHACLHLRGIDEKQAADLRARLATFTEDWDSPEMNLYDDYDSAIMTLKLAEDTFRQGWLEAQSGQTRPVTELWDGIDAE
jgi:hypothetical protein